MLIDQELVFSDGQAITADATSTNVVDGRVAGLGAGNPLELVAKIDEAFNTLTSLDFTLQSSVDEAFTSPIPHQKVNVALAKLTANAVIDLGTIPDSAARYLRLHYDVQGTNPSTGKITSFIAPFGKPTFPNQNG